MQTLTAEQEAKISSYKEAYFKHAVCTDPADRAKAEASIRALYALVGLAEPKEFVWVRSPKEAQEAINKDRGTSNVYYPTHSYGYGQNEASWIAFYKFFENEVGVTYPEQAKKGLDIMHAIMESAGWWWPFEDVCVCSERPVKISLSQPGNILHCEDGPAIAYPDGFTAWYLNGVRVNERLVMTPAEQLDPTTDGLKEQNVEIRREVLRKIGASRFLEKLGAKLLDRETVSSEAGEPSDYELYHVEMGAEVGVAAYLKMKNPSIGVYHVECVGTEEVKTVKDALFVRNKSRLAPIKLT